MQGPLSGVVVLDLSRALAGPHAAQMLGDLGAHVIKIENPTGGDEARGWGPHVGPDGDISTYFLAANRNKRSITLDLKADEGRDTLTRLIRHADVLIENFRTGVLARLGFSTERIEELNPRMVVLSITGFGHDGPEGGRPGYDQIAQGEAGLMSITGPPGQPHRAGPSIADLLAGIHGAYGVAAALYEREKTGKGGVVRTSLLASVVGVHAYHGTQWTVAGQVPQGNGNHHASIAPFGAFRCGDGMIQIAAGTEGHWQKVAELLGIDATRPEYATNRDRFASRDQLVERDGEGADHRDPRPLARSARQGRGPRRVHPDHRRGLRLGPDPLPGAARRGRPPRPRPDRAARTGAPLRRPPAGRPHRPARPRRRQRGRPRLAQGERGAVTPERPDARTLIEVVLDPGSWVSWDRPPAEAAAPGSSYAAELAAARRKSGYDESIITGEGRLGGRRVAVVAGEFSFLAGSIGVAAAERLVSAVERATAERLPLLAAPASGGTRMQEGAMAFVQMIKITAAVTAHKEAGLPTSSTCAIRPPGACSRRGDRSATSPPPNRAR